MTDSQIENTVVTYSDMLFKLSFTLLHNKEDAEDTVSEVFIKYISKSPKFESEEHKKAWLLRVCINESKNMLKFYKRKNCISFEDIKEYAKTREESNIFSELFKLPKKYLVVLHLYYVEGYKTKEIADMLSIKETAVRKRLQYGRNMLKIEYGKEDNI